MEKLASITAVDINYEDQLNEDTVENVYEGLAALNESAFLNNIVALQKFWTKKEISRIAETPKVMGDIDYMGFDSTLVIKLNCNF